jgi:hypothetical protein
MSDLNNNELEFLQNHVNHEPNNITNTTKNKKSLKLRKSKEDMIYRHHEYYDNYSKFYTIIDKRVDENPNLAELKDTKGKVYIDWCECNICKVKLFVRDYKAHHNYYHQYLQYVRSTYNKLKFDEIAN